MLGTSELTLLETVIIAHSRTLLGYEDLVHLHHIVHPESGCNLIPKCR